MARDYEVDGVPTDPIQNCEICTKNEHRVVGETSEAKGLEPKEIPSDESKRERREHREGESGSLPGSINRFR
jgi:hypothetical protein